MSSTLHLLLHSALSDKRGAGGGGGEGDHDDEVWVGGGEVIQGGGRVAGHAEVGHQA